MGLGSLTVLWLGGRMVVAGEVTLGRVRRLRRLPGDAPLADDRARLGGEPDRARRGVDGAHPRDPRPAAARSATRRRSRVERHPRRGRVPRPELRLRRRAGAARHRPARRRPAAPWRSSGRPAAARARSCRCCRGSSTRRRARVFVDGHDVRRLPLATLRAAIGFVPQESFLFSATLRENVALAEGSEARARSGPPGSPQLEKDVRDFPEGFETRVGERGITLSGGQQQRTALARALADRPAHPGPRRLALGGRHRDRGADPAGPARR